MIDAHIHLENGPYTKAWLQEFVDQAVLLGIDEINLVEHSHRFKEFMPIYQDVIKVGGAMAKWILNKNPLPIKEYQQFITAMRQEQWPIEVNFGLEICFFASYQDIIAQQISAFTYDLIIGSIHYVFNIAYDLKGISQEYLWDKYPVDDIYRQYYQDVETLISSKLFNIVGHLDTIKMFNYLPNYDLIPTYQRVAKLLKTNNVIAENNSGCHYRYGHYQIGLDEQLLTTLIEYDVKIVTSSDAHHPSDVGRNIIDLLPLIK